MALSPKHTSKVNNCCQCFISATFGCRSDPVCFIIFDSLLTVSNRRWARRIQLEPLDHQAASATLNTHLDTALAHAYIEYLEQYGRNDVHYWSSRLLAKRLAEVGSGDDEENEVVKEQVRTQTQPYEITEPANHNQLNRVYHDDESDEENLRSILAKSKRVKLESGGTASLSSIPNHASRHASLETGQSSYRTPLKMATAVGNIKVEAEKAE